MPRHPTDWKKAKTWQDIRPYLTPRQRIFVETYSAIPNATNAAKEAGYRGTENTLSVIGHENLGKLKIKMALELKTKANGSARPAIADRTELQEFWTDIIRDVDKAIPDRLKSADSLAKSQGLFIDRVEVRGAIANLSMRELVDHIETKARLLGVTVQLPALPDLESHSDTIQ